MAWGTAPDDGGGLLDVGGIPLVVPLWTEPVWAALAAPEAPYPPGPGALGSPGDGEAASGTSSSDDGWWPGTGDGAAGMPPGALMKGFPWFGVVYAGTNDGGLKVGPGPKEIPGLPKWGCGGWPALWLLSAASS